MLRRIVVVVAGLLVLLIAVAGVALTWAHVALRNAESPLPELAALSAAPPPGDMPVSISYINTASQPMPRASVLDPSSDPTPQAPYVMSHPSFVLRWADGRILLIDTGMTPEDAIAFGKPVEMLAGAQPTEAHGAVADVLGGHVGHVAGVMFTHLHTDHVGGLQALCAKHSRPLSLPMTHAQTAFTNYTTRPARKLIAGAGCAKVQEIQEGGLQPVPGFAGVSVFAAGGHTPDTQVILAAVNGAGGLRRYAFLGDVVNNIDGINNNVPKPFFYRWFIVPEDNVRLGDLRVLLRQLRDEAGVTLLPAHDQLAIEASGVPRYSEGG